MSIQHWLPFTYKGDFLLNIAILKIIALEGLVGPVQLPGNTKIGEEDDQTREERAEYRQSYDEGGVVQGLPVAGPVYWAGKSKWLRSIAAPAQQRKRGPQASIQPDPTDHKTDGSSLELDTCAQTDMKLSLVFQLYVYFVIYIDTALLCATVYANYCYMALAP